MFLICRLVPCDYRECIELSVYEEVLHVWILCPEAVEVRHCLLVHVLKQRLKNSNRCVHWKIGWADICDVWPVVRGKKNVLLLIIA